MTYLRGLACFTFVQVAVLTVACRERVGGLVFRDSSDAPPDISDQTIGSERGPVLTSRAEDMKAHLGMAQKLHHLPSALPLCGGHLGGGEEDIAYDHGISGRSGTYLHSQHGPAHLHLLGAPAAREAVARNGILEECGGTHCGEVEKRVAHALPQLSKLAFGRRFVSFSLRTADSK